MSETEVAAAGSPSTTHSSGGPGWVDPKTTQKLQLSLDELIEEETKKTIPSYRPTRRLRKAREPFLEAGDWMDEHDPRASQLKNTRWREGDFRQANGPYGDPLNRRPLPPFAASHVPFPPPYGPPHVMPRGLYPPVFQREVLARHFSQQLARREALVTYWRRMSSHPYPAVAFNGLLPAERLAPRKSRPLRGHLEDPLMAAEVSALGDTEIIYPVFVEAPAPESAMNIDAIGESGESTASAHVGDTSHSGDITHQNEVPQEMIPSPDVDLIVRFKGTDVLLVKKGKGDLILNSGGWRTVSTKIVLNSALKPLGLWIEEVAQTEKSVDKPPAWRVVDGVSYLAAFTDGMTVGATGASSRAQLLARASVIAQHLKQAKSNAIVKRGGRRLGGL